MISLNPYNIPGFPDAQKMSELLSVYNYHEGRNKTKSRYYEGHIRLNEVNLGIAIPKSYSNLEVGCEWGAKCVDVLASRSMFDGFVSASGDDASEMNRIMDLNRMRIEYHKATCDELKYGCSFATLSADRKIGCKIRFHSPETAAALWNGEKGRIDCGFAIIDTAYDESDQTWTPALINYYNDTDVYILRRAGTKWSGKVSTEDGEAADGAANLECHQFEAVRKITDQRTDPAINSGVCANDGRGYACA